MSPTSYKVKIVHEWELNFLINVECKCVNVSPIIFGKFVYKCVSMSSTINCFPWISKIFDSKSKTFGVPLNT